MPRSRSKVALLLIDWINDLEFDEGEKLFPQALAAAKATAALRRRAKQAEVPVIYCNDNFGRWRSDFRALLAHVLEDGVRGPPLAELLARVGGGGGGELGEAGRGAEGRAESPPEREDQPDRREDGDGRALRGDVE